MDTDKSNIILGVLFIIILISGTFIFFFINKFDVFHKTEEEPPNLTYDMRIKCPDNSNYVLKYKKIPISSGKINKDSIEKIKNIDSDKKYNLFCWKDDNTDNDFYMGERLCYNTTECILDLKQQGKINSNYEVYVDNIDYNIYVENYILEPLVCISWIDMYYVKNTELTKVDIPERLQSSYDVCYSFETLRDTDKFFKFLFKKKNDGASVKISIIDKCNVGLIQDYSECGIPDYTDNIIIR